MVKRVVIKDQPRESCSNNFFPISFRKLWHQGTAKQSRGSSDDDSAFIHNFSAKEHNISPDDWLFKLFVICLCLQIIRLLRNFPPFIQKVNAETLPEHEMWVRFQWLFLANFGPFFATVSN